MVVDVIKKKKEEIIERNANYVNWLKEKKN